MMPNQSGDSFALDPRGGAYALPFLFAKQSALPKATHNKQFPAYLRVAPPVIKPLEYALKLTLLDSNPLMSTSCRVILHSVDLERTRSRSPGASQYRIFRSSGARLNPLCEAGQRS